MKRRRKALVVIAILLVIFLVAFIARNNIKGQIEDELNTRYPIDTFEVTGVQVNLIPLGFRADVEAKNTGTEFTADYIWHFGEDNEVTDNLFERRTLDHFADEFLAFKEINQDWLEGVNIVPISLNTDTLISSMDVFPVRVDFLLAKEISTVDDFKESIRHLAHELETDTVEGVDAYRFYSFPGSITENNSRELGLEPDNLTQPTVSPTPTPTPDPDETTETTEEVEETTETEETTTTEARNPLYVLEFNALKDALAIDELTLHNGIRYRLLDSREISTMEATYDLDDDAQRYLDEAQRRQTRDEDLAAAISSARAEGQELTTPTETEFQPSQATATTTRD